MIYEIKHITRYDYADEVNLCYNTLVLKPLTDSNQQLMEYTLTVSPMPEDIEERTDFFGNTVVYFSMAVPHKSLEIVSFSKVDVVPPSGTPAPGITVAEAMEMLDVLNDENIFAKQFMFESPMVSGSEAIKEYALRSFAPDRPLAEAGYDLMQRIFNDFEFNPDFTTVSTPVTEVFENKKGVCQDFAHFALACARSMGLPAKYISGYLETLPPPGQEKLVGADASHAWFALYVPGTGWIEYDPTNNMMPGPRHIRVASGRDYADITPVKGVIFSGGGHSLRVSVDVRSV